MYPLNNVVRHPNFLSILFSCRVARLPTAYRTTTYSNNMHHIEYGICYCVLASNALFLIQLKRPVFYLPIFLNSVSERLVGTIDNHKNSSKCDMSALL